MEEFLIHNDMKLLSSVTQLQKSILIQTEHLSDQLTKKLHRYTLKGYRRIQSQVLYYLYSVSYLIYRT